MTAYIAYTIFGRRVPKPNDTTWTHKTYEASGDTTTYEASGDEAERLLQAFHNIKGSEAHEGDVIAGCRIDRIGSEDHAITAA